MNIWDQIKKRINDSHPLYLLTVIESSGSAPGRRGFMMLVDNQGTLYGSIGGGIMEYNLVEKAKQLLTSKTYSSFCIRQVHRGDAHASSGMICSGEQTIAFTPLSGNDKDVITACATSDMIQISQEGIKPSCDNKEEICKIKSESDWLYTQLQKQSTTVHLFGAGHVSVPTCELLKKLGYQVYLYDNRSDINTLNDNNYAHSKLVIDYADVLASVKFSDEDFVILMTHKFIEDKLILSQILEKKLGYLGVLGSKNKINVMFKALINEGHKQSDLDTVFAPIGLDIHSKTTNEIAISIVAELIKIKNA